jgi:hypothetical protein
MALDRLKGAEGEVLAARDPQHALRVAHGALRGRRDAPDGADEDVSGHRRSGG